MDTIYNPIVVDIETVGLPNAVEYLEPPQPDKRLKDEAKIAADLEAKQAEQLALCSLDCNVGRIAAIGAWFDGVGVTTCTCPTEAEETTALKWFWDMAKRRTIVGFNIKGFDLRFLIRRSQLLDIPYPRLDLGKYSRKDVLDLYQELTFNDGHFDKGAMRRSLKAFCKRFGIPVNDNINGADVPGLIAAGKWDEVVFHVRSDVEMTVALARRLGVIKPVPLVPEEMVF